MKTVILMTVLSLRSGSFVRSAEPIRALLSARKNKAYYTFGGAPKNTGIEILGIGLSVQFPDFVQRIRFRVSI